MKNTLIKLGGLGIGLAIVPLFAFAAACPPTGDLGFVLCQVGNLLNSVVPVLIALGVVYFVWGVVSYVLAQEEEAKTTGRDKMIYGLIGIVVIVSMWGLVSILRNTFSLSNSGNNAGQVPCIPIPPATSC